MYQLLVFETILKVTAGFLLLFVPSATAAIFGLPRNMETLIWPRLLGACLVGLAGGTYLELSGFDGISIRACIALNFVGACALFGLLILGRAAPTWRGRQIMGLTGVLLFGLVLLEIAYI